MSKTLVSPIEFAHSLAPDNARILSYLAMALEHSQNYSAAIDAYAKLALSNSDSDLYLEKVIKLAKEHEFHSILAKFEIIKSFRSMRKSVEQSNSGKPHSEQNTAAEVNATEKQAKISLVTINGKYVLRNLREPED